VIPLRDDPETTSPRRCLNCGTTLNQPRGRQAYCTPACRQKAWRARTSHQPSTAPTPAPLPRRRHGIYQCPTCEEITLGAQRCDECNVFTRRIGTGGPCPHCSEPVSIDQLLAPT
jgi:hypothetical protein